MIYFIAVIVLLIYAVRRINILPRHMLHREYPLFPMHSDLFAVKIREVLNRSIKLSVAFLNGDCGFLVDGCIV